MNEIYVHVTGVVATDVEARKVDDVMVASFRLVSTTRRFDRGERSWVDGDKTWLTVTCWRQLAANVHASVRKTERVVVTGRLKVAEWRDAEGRPRTRVEVVAESVGHDLTFGRSVLTRTPRVEVLPDEKARVAADLAEEQERRTEGMDVATLLVPPARMGETGADTGLDAVIGDVDAVLEALVDFPEDAEAADTAGERTARETGLGRDAEAGEAVTAAAGRLVEAGVSASDGGDASEPVGAERGRRRR